MESDALFLRLFHCSSTVVVRECVRSNAECGAVMQSLAHQVPPATLSQPQHVAVAP